MASGKKSKEEVAKILALFHLDEKWQVIREKILAGKVPFEAGIHGFRLLIETMFDSDPVSGSEPTADSAAATAENGADASDQGVTKPRMLARAEPRNVPRRVDGVDAANESAERLTIWSRTGGSGWRSNSTRNTASASKSLGRT